MLSPCTLILPANEDSGIQTISDSEEEQHEPKPELKEEPPDTENISETEETPENQQEIFSAEHIEQEFITFINLYQTKSLLDYSKVQYSNC
ncbi:hypothetical protein JTB14_011952 [Gonioctena quinquepunctata]|nr:hypothetical protein JTB14_006272 [Gonioctena quinquepunctata]KAG5873880.1 hypothetical protein JTB14_011952 [Gonioctena quinquepunctata]